MRNRRPAGVIVTAAVMISLARYSFRLLRFGGAGEILGWRAHTAYGFKRWPEVRDVFEFGRWCIDVGRYRTMDCSPWRGGGVASVG